MSTELGVGLLKSLHHAAGLTKSKWRDLLHKEATPTDHAKMQLALLHSNVCRVNPIGKGVHRPYRVFLQTKYHSGFVHCSECVFKTAYSQMETKPYCASMDLSITGPEREWLAYSLDQALGFDLVPPVVLREVEPLGVGSVMAWVNQPLVIDWIKYNRYDYKEHPENPWLHKLAAFDFLTGQIDRHAANVILDCHGRVYAIDNGYSFVKGDDRKNLKCNMGRALVGKKVHPYVQEFVKHIDPYIVKDVMGTVDFHNDEVYGVIKRLNELKALRVWSKDLGGKWVKKVV